VVLLHNDPETDTIELRHYEITVKPTGLSKSVKRLLKTDIPDLSKFDDISDYILRGGDGCVPPRCWCDCVRAIVGAIVLAPFFSRDCVGAIVLVRLWWCDSCNLIVLLHIALLAR
jgi:ribosome biogenesis protein SSF1/2